MQIRENWTDLEGELIEATLSRTRKGFVELRIKVLAARPVKGYANFLGDRVNTLLTVYIRRDAVDPRKLVKGARISVRARRGRSPDEIFAHTRSLKVY